MASVKKIKLTGNSEFDPSSLVSLPFDQLSSLTPENSHFLFPSEADIQQQYTLRNVRRYTCAFLVGVFGLMGGMGEVCANVEDEQKPPPYAASAPSFPYAEVSTEAVDISGLRNNRGDVQLHESRPWSEKFSRHPRHPDLKYPVERLGNAARFGKTIEERADGLSGLAKIEKKHENKTANALLLAILRDETSDMQLATIEAILNIPSERDFRRLKKFVQKENLQGTKTYKLSVGRSKRLKRNPFKRLG